jgi:hypothetical protein
MPSIRPTVSRCDPVFVLDASAPHEIDLDLWHEGNWSRAQGGMMQTVVLCFVPKNRLFSSRIEKTGLRGDGHGCAITVSGPGRGMPDPRKSPALHPRLVKKSTYCCVGSQRPPVTPTDWSSGNRAYGQVPARVRPPV